MLLDLWGALGTPRIPPAPPAERRLLLGEFYGPFGEIVPTITATLPSGRRTTEIDVGEVAE